MDETMFARCGTYCAECKFREGTGCPGCIKAAGKMFWGTCQIAQCCNGKGLQHCRQCPDMPCQMLKDYSYDETHGDNGRRIANLREWTQQGMQAWAMKRQKPET